MIHPHSKFVKWFCPKWVEAITFPWGIYFRGCPTQRLLKHETKHLEQISRGGILKFYSTYLYQYLVGIIKYRDMRLAYLAISYEREARRAERS